MAKLRNVLTPVSCAAVRVWDRAALNFPLIVRMKSGTRALMRPAPASDLNVFYEVFVKRVYNPPFDLDPESVRLVVDLGGNVGYSNLFWLESFPNAEVMTYEPMPDHVKLVARNVELNRCGHRVSVMAAAAGSGEGVAFFVDHGAESTRAEGAKAEDVLNPNMVQVRVADVFDGLSDRPVDILKIDIEGGEYTLLADPRFKGLRPRVVCMEAHPYSALMLDQEGADKFWQDHWAAAGYKTSLNRGIVWAVRQ
jgi:FkbM family methyltransferase